MREIVLIEADVEPSIELGAGSARGPDAGSGTDCFDLPPTLITVTPVRRSERLLKKRICTHKIK